MEGETILTELLLVPLEDTVVFPGMSVTLTVDVGDEERVLLVPKHEGEFAKVGTVADVVDHVRLSGGARAGELRVEVEEHEDDVPVTGAVRELERDYRAVVEELLELRGDNGRIAQFVRSISEPGTLADTSAYSPDLSFEDRVK